MTTQTTEDADMHRTEIHKLNHDMQQAFFKMLLDDYTDYYKHVGAIMHITSEILRRATLIIQLEKSNQDGKQEPI